MADNENIEDTGVIDERPEER
jgi:prolyl-tRNA editing enzyme YbaK/EbsC (Cys-tRNA(Pro) deacylase)